MSTLKTLFRKKSVEQILIDQSESADANHGATGMKKALGVLDLTALGIAAVIGAGIFSTIGTAAAAGGPAVVFLFLFTAVACAFSAFCYAEFASSIPVSGSAYTYAYASLGELLAWIIGWDLLMEYAIGNIAVAISWSDYFTSLLEGYGFHLPAWITMDLLTASRGYETVQTVLDSGTAYADLVSRGMSPSTITAYEAWVHAPQIFGIHLVADLPAMLVTALVTYIVYIGIQESKRVNNIMVLLKLAVLMMVIGVGAFYVKPENFSPFSPNGVTGVLKGVSGVFFAYIGFDAISTTAEECKNPQRDLPRAMMYVLGVCTVIYIAVALVLTGMVKYDQLAVGDPLTFVFGPEGVNIHWISGLVGVSAIIAIFTVLLVFQLGQPRIWMVMSRDGLLPRVFSKLHPKYQTPSFSTIVTGLFVGIPCMFMNLTEVTDLCSIGTLFAFILVCTGVLRMDPNRPKVAGRFYTPYINGQFIFPGLTLLAAVAYYYFNPEGVQEFFRYDSFDLFAAKIPFIVFICGMIYLSIITYLKKLSLIPLLGLASCGYLMTELGWTNWLRFGIWLIAGLIIYFLYGYRNSKLNHLHKGTRHAN